MDTFGKKLKSERRRLRYTQEAFAAVGGVKKLSQISYEQGKTCPDAGYLVAIAGIGVDVLMLLTDGTSERMLSSEESRLIRSFRVLDERGQLRALSFMEGMALAVDLKLGK